MKHILNKLEDMSIFANDFAKELNPNESSAKVVGLYGDLGSGKTTFTQSLAKYFGVEETIVSPTFVILKIYNLENQKFDRLVHIDAYRLESSEELLKLGFKEIISDPKNLVLIEWPEKVAEIMPEHTKIYIKHTEKYDSREVEVE